MEVREIQSIALNILNDVHLFCIEHHLKYYLFRGTLLGAIRHDGFIPWDDDVDIAMPREDYEEFIKLYNQEDRKYKLISREDSNYVYPFAKVYDPDYPIKERARFDCHIGIYIDIYPLDSFPEEETAIRNMEKHLWNYKMLWSGVTNISNLNSKSICKKVLSRFFTQKRVNRMIVSFEKYAGKTTEKSRYRNYFVAFSIKKRKIKWFDIDDFEPVLHKFENGNYYIPCGAHNVLKVLYGDYMVLPPEEERKPKHSFSVL